MGKYLFFDIDGTLIGKSGLITDKTRQAISQARQNGHKAYICTGRPPAFLYDDMKSVGFDGYICCAGGLVFTDEHVIYENAIDKELLQRTMDLFEKHHMGYMLETKDAIYVSQAFQRVHKSQYIKNYKQIIKEVICAPKKCIQFFRRNVSNQKRLPIKQFDISSQSAIKITFNTLLKNDFEKCKSLLENDYHIVLYSKEEDDYIMGEIILKSCTKAQGICQVLEYENASIEDTIGFGDSMNDYQMLEMVHTGVVYKNASQQLKQLGQYYFDDPDHDGIYDVMKEMNLI